MDRPRAVPVAAEKRRAAPVAVPLMEEPEVAVAAELRAAAPAEVVPPAGPMEEVALPAAAGQRMAGLLTAGIARRCHLMALISLPGWKREVSRKPIHAHLKRPEMWRKTLLAWSLTRPNQVATLSLTICRMGRCSTFRRTCSMSVLGSPSAASRSFGQTAMR